MKISIVIPIYNCDGLIEKNVNVLINYLDTKAYDYEILLCDDGSNDRSSNILNDLAVMYDQVKVFFNSANEGLGFTLKELFSQSSGEKVVYLDCDIPFGPTIITELIDANNEFDIVVASRYLHIKNNISLLRKLTSRLYYYLCKLLFNISVMDIGSGAVAFRRNALNQLHLTQKGFGVHAEIFIQAKNLSLSIKEIPAQMINFETGSFSVWRHGGNIIKETFHLYSHKNR
jgi:glycosyltransferase involved in cell wall biosynthesis